MITYATLKNNPRQFLGMTSLTVPVFDALVPTFLQESRLHSLIHTRAGKPRRRKAGGGNKARLATLEDQFVKETLRNTKEGFSDLVMRVTCALHNWRISLRHPTPASKQEILTFSKKFEKCLDNIGNNELAIDTIRLRDLVSLNPDAAYGFVELYCSMAQSQPAYLMTAYTVAMVYGIVFENDSLEKMVLERVKELDAQKYIMDIRVD